MNTTQSIGQIIGELLKESDGGQAFSIVNVVDRATTKGYSPNDVYDGLRILARAQTITLGVAAVPTERMKTFACYDEWGAAKHVVLVNFASELI